MDEIVKAALRKWPNVPHCHGWLALDARGDWYMRDDRVQAAGPFPLVKGSRIQHAKLLEFIGRNYASDENGCWFFQNGPQRVYVQLEAAPWVWRVSVQQPAGGAATWTLASHTGREAVLRGSWLCEAGRLFLDTDLGLGIVHTLDMDIAADAVEAGHFVPQELAFAEMPARFGFVLMPQSQTQPQLVPATPRPERAH